MTRHYYWYLPLVLLAVLTDWLVINHASWKGNLYHWLYWTVAWLCCLLIVSRTVRTIAVRILRKLAHLAASPAFLKSLSLVVLLAVLEDAGYIAVIGLKTHTWPYPQDYSWLASYFGGWTACLGKAWLLGMPSGYFIGLAVSGACWAMGEKRA